MCFQGNRWVEMMLLCPALSFENEENPSKRSHLSQRLNGQATICEEHDPVAQDAIPQIPYSFPHPTWSGFSVLNGSSCHTVCWVFHGVSDMHLSL